MITVSARCSTLEATCDDLAAAPSANMVRGYLYDIPYYGQQQPQDPERPEINPDYWVCCREARAGTTRFFCCAAFYVMHHRVHLNLAVHFVHPGEALVTVLENLLAQYDSQHSAARPTGNSLCPYAWCAPSSRAGTRQGTCSGWCMSCSTCPTNRCARSARITDVVRARDRLTLDAAKMPGASQRPS